MSLPNRPSPDDSMTNAERAVLGKLALLEVRKRKLLKELVAVECERQQVLIDYGFMQLEILK